MTIVFALPTEWRVIDGKGQVFRFNAKGEMTPTLDMVLTKEKADEWSHAVRDATSIINFASRKNG